MSSSEVSQNLIRALLVLVLVIATATLARPSHFGGESIQGVVSEPEVGSSTNLNSPSVGLLLHNLKPWQLEVLLAQRLAELTGPQQQQQLNLLTNNYDNNLSGGNNLNNNNNNNDLIWERAIRAAESKRQSRYRQCYFNPISCFKK